MNHEYNGTIKYYTVTDDLAGYVTFNFKNVKYGFNENEAFDVTVGIYDADGVAIDGGIDTSGNIKKAGTLKIKIVYKDRVKLTKTIA